LASRKLASRTSKVTSWRRTQIEPDVKVSNNPEMVSEGEDQQLEKAVELLMQN
jgi:hypothetical protein